MKKKPIAAKRPQPKARQSDDDTGQDGQDEPAAAPAPPAEDELALQAAPATNFPGEQLKTMRRRTPPDAKGTLLDVQDTSKLLIAAWVVLGAVVIGSIYWFAVRSDKDVETARNTDTSQPLPQAATNAAKAKAADADAKYKTNPSNSAAFANYLKFGQWAQANANDWGGDKLIDKMKQDVSLASVDDPDVKELLELQQENWKLMPAHPLRPYESQGNAVGEVTGQQNNSTALNKYKVNDGKIKGLTATLRKRYGVNL